MSNFAVLGPHGSYVDASYAHHYPFDTFEKAQACAQDAAKEYPGKSVRIAVIVAEVTAPVMPPQTVRTVSADTFDAVS